MQRHAGNPRREPRQCNGCMAHTRTRATRKRALARGRLVYHQSRVFRYPLDRNYLAFVPKGITSTTPHPQGFQASLPAQPMPFGESLGPSNQRGSKTSQACYGRPRCNLELVRLFRFSLPLPDFRHLFLFPHPCGHKPTAPFAYCALPNPRV